MSQEFDEFQFAMRHYWKQHRGLIVTALVLVGVFWALGTVFYKVDADSRGVVLRLGKPLEPTMPGLHFKMPWPIDRVAKVPVEKVQAIEFGYQTVAPGRRTQYAATSDSQKTMARILTGDLNLAHVEWVVQYRISDPNDYLFKIGGGPSQPANAADLIGDVSEAVMRRIIGDGSVDSVITTGREKVANDAMKEMQAMLDGFESGVKVVAVKLQSATPPEPVKDAFDEVNRAKQMKEKVVNDAKGKRNAQIPRARGERDRAIAEAEGYALKVEKTAEGRANAFLAKLAEYQKAPEITKVRLYLEAMEVIFAQVQEKVIIDESLQGMLPLLHLDGGGGGLTGTDSMRRNRTGGGR